MAAEGDLDKEMNAHLGGYERFIRLMKWGAILSLVTGFIVILLIRQ
ncbi:MAG TPA: hypothetical protein VHM92_03265 [Allosphingosinicella sp.]|nr:hypothetical protein [Allosphingosinicella sp.]